MFSIPRSVIYRTPLIKREVMSLWLYVSFSHTDFQKKVESLLQEHYKWTYATSILSNTQFINS